MRVTVSICSTKVFFLYLYLKKKYKSLTKKYNFLLNNWCKCTSLVYSSSLSSRAYLLMWIPLLDTNLSKRAVHSLKLKSKLRFHPYKNSTLFITQKKHLYPASLQTSDLRLKKGHCYEIRHNITLNLTPLRSFNGGY